MQPCLMLPASHLFGAPPKETMQPCLIYLHLILWCRQRRPALGHAEQPGGYAGRDWVSVCATALFYPPLGASMQRKALFCPPLAVLTWCAFVACVEHSQSRRGRGRRDGRKILVQVRANTRHSTSRETLSERQRNARHSTASTCGITF